jgi:hypothetical protein
MSSVFYFLKGPHLLRALVPPSVDAERVSAIQARATERDGMIPVHHKAPGEVAEQHHYSLLEVAVCVFDEELTHPVRDVLTRVL